MPVHDTLPAGAFTLSGKTGGPAVSPGRNRYNKSQMIWVHLDELRDLIADAGWATPDTHERLLADHQKSQELVEGLLAERNELVQKVDDLEKALGWKPKAPAKKPVKTAA